MRAPLLFFLLLFVSGAVAQLRTIPKEAQYGEIRHLEAMVVELNGKPAQLSPGAQVRDPDNRLLVPTALTQKVGVGYVLDGGGLVHRVWILSPQELARIPRPPGSPAVADK
jgi:hypothetical protein